MVLFLDVMFEDIALVAYGKRSECFGFFSLLAATFLGDLRSLVRFVSFWKKPAKSE